MKHISILSICLFCITLVACDESTNPPFKLDLIEPDWTLLGDGNWSPWFANEAGETVWNPSASFNAWLNTIPEEDKAWPILVDAEIKYSDLFKNSLIGAVPSSWNKDINNDGERDWDQLKDIFTNTDMPPIISMLNAAISKPHVGEPMLIQSSQQLRKMSHHERRQALVNPAIDTNANPFISHCASNAPSLIFKSKLILISYCIYLAETGQLDACVQQIISILDSNLLFRERTNSYSSIYSSQGQIQAFRALRWIIYNYGDQLTDKQFKKIDRAIERDANLPFSHIGSHLQFHDTIRRLHSFPKTQRSYDRLIEKNTNTKPLSATYITLNGTTRETLALFDIPMRALANNTRTGLIDGRFPAWFVNMGSYADLEYPVSDFDKEVLDLEIPPLGSYHNGQIEYQAYRDAIRLAIAIHRHKLRHHHFPDSIDRIDQDLIAFTTKDPFTGNRLLYRISDEFGPMIYAAGIDLDDDHGSNNEYVSIGTRIPDGDFVLYPNP